YDQRINGTRFRRLIRGLVGLRVTRPWLGYGAVLFLELGKLQTVVTPIRGLPTVRSREGQATIMVHSEWRAEWSNRFAFGMESPQLELDSGTQALRGRRITAISLTGRLPELVVELDRTLWLRSFNSWGPPCWTIFLGDVQMFPLE